jgi:hypothetical protein
MDLEVFGVSAARPEVYWFVFQTLLIGCDGQETKMTIHVAVDVVFVSALEAGEEVAVQRNMMME